MNTKASTVELWLRAGLYWCDSHAKDVHREITLKDSRGLVYGTVTLVAFEHLYPRAWAYTGLYDEYSAKHGMSAGRCYDSLGDQPNVETAQAAVFKAARSLIAEAWS